MKHLLWTSLAGLFGILVAFALTNGGAKAYQILTDRFGTFSYQTAAVFQSVIPPPEPVTLTFVGDLMLDRGVRQLVEKNGNGDYAWLFAKLDNFPAGDTVLFGNLEGPLSDQGADRHNLYSFRMAPSSLPAIKQAGFQVLSVANNHIGDWGREAFTDTLARLNGAGILAVGGGENKFAAASPQIINRHGQRIGFLAFSDVGPTELAASETQAGIILASDPNLPAIISQAAAQVDALVVSFHWGEEYQIHSNSRQQALAHVAIEAGARLVIGTHPHVAQELEHYQGGLIAYSLGNFIFDQGFSAETMSGLALRVTLDQGEITKVETQAVNLNSQFQPSLGEIQTYDF